MKLKFMIFGNCQALPLRQLLSSSEHFSSKFELIGLHLKPIHLLTNEDWVDLQCLLESVDLFIYQNAAERFGLFCTNNLFAYLKPNCIKLAYPSLFFKGYNPETVFLRNVNFRSNRFVNYDDLNFARIYITNGIAGLKLMEKCVRASDYYDEKFLHMNFQESIIELQTREEICDVTISDFIGSNWRRERLFYSVNHPTNSTLNELASRILKYLGLRSLKSSELPENEFLGGIILPIYNSICEKLGIEFLDRVKINNSWYPLNAYIANSINEYERVNPQDLVNSFEEFACSNSLSLKQIATLHRQH